MRENFKHRIANSLDNIQDPTKGYIALPHYKQQCESNLFRVSPCYKLTCFTCLRQCEGKKRGKKMQGANKKD